MTLCDEVCRILYREWDPIGVKGAGGPADEYNSYADTIVRYIRERRDIHLLTAHLQQLRRHAMGLNATDDENDRRVAELLHELGE